MKKNFFTTLLFMLVITIIVVSVSTVNLNSIKFKFGELDHDDSGKVTGCSGTGDECMFVY
ncbi:MAG: hypothetical protein KAW12_02525 [Candidatus Aminicenantes bacterium]|nr:hypothetical protein [Candidatus Aminicenantes bacterium]